MAEVDFPRFVLRVLSNDKRKDCLVVFDVANTDAFVAEAWTHLHGVAAGDGSDIVVVPTHIVLEHLDGGVIDVQNSRHIVLLQTLAMNHLAATGLPLAVRIRARDMPRARDGDDGGEYYEITPVENHVSLGLSTSPYSAPRARIVKTDVDEAIAAAEHGRREKPGRQRKMEQLEAALFGEAVAQLPEFDEEEENKAEAVDDEMSDCLWWLKASHPLAQAFEILTMVVILVSVMGFILETLPQYRLDENRKPRDDTHPTFFAIETVCIAWFTIEYSMRLYAAGADRFRKWIWKPMNLVDLIAIVPYYIGLAIGSSGASSIAIIRILRLSRVTRLFKLSRHSEGLQDLIYCLSSTQKEIGLFFVISIVAGVLFAAAVFYCEEGADSGFVSIPEGLWWAIVTMTTVGYGDISPVTVQGKFVGALCASIGVILLAIPASIFISQFMRLHQERQLESSKYLKHEAALEKLRLMTEDFSGAVEVYAILRDEYDKKLKKYFTKKISALQSDSEGLLSGGKRAQIPLDSIDEGQNYQVTNSDDED